MSIYSSIIFSNFKSLVVACKVQLPDNKELYSGLENTQAYYCKNNSLSIAHERSSQGHGDIADATVTSVAATRIPPEKKPPQKIYYSDPLGGVWVEDNGVEKPFNWPHLVEE